MSFPAQALQRLPIVSRINHQPWQTKFMSSVFDGSCPPSALQPQFLPILVLCIVGLTAGKLCFDSFSMVQPLLKCYLFSSGIIPCPLATSYDTSIYFMIPTTIKISFKSFCFFVMVYHLYIVPYRILSS